MHGNVRIPALRTRKLRTFPFLKDTLQAGGSNLDVFCRFEAHQTPLLRRLTISGLN